MAQRTVISSLLTVEDPELTQIYLCRQLESYETHLQKQNAAFRSCSTSFPVDHEPSAVYDGEQIESQRSQHIASQSHVSVCIFTSW